LSLVDPNDTRAFKSPQLLELSGIGDPAILEPLGIDVKVNLPGVGANANDHISIPVSFGKYHRILWFQRGWTLSPAIVNLELKGDNWITLDSLQDPAFAAKAYAE
jgi:hypothetical protein